jgi:hypothetical protein
MTPNEILKQVFEYFMAPEHWSDGYDAKDWTGENDNIIGSVTRSGGSEDLFLKLKNASWATCHCWQGAIYKFAPTLELAEATLLHAATLVPEVKHPDGEPPHTGYGDDLHEASNRIIHFNDANGHEAVLTVLEKAIAA